MIVYLVFGLCNGFGNDCFLSAVCRTQEEAEKNLLNTYCYDILIKDLDKKRKKSLTKIKKVKNLQDIDDAGIYQITI